MPPSLEQIRWQAKTNLCSDCYKHYIRILEPNIKSLYFHFLDDWRNVETYATKMIIKHKGLFKNDLSQIDILETTYDDAMKVTDVQFVERIGRWPFEKKLNYLFEKEIIPEWCHQLLDHVRNVRNRTHKDPVIYKISEKDLELFHYALDVIYPFYSEMMFGVSGPINYGKIYAKKICDKIINELNTNKK